MSLDDKIFVSIDDCVNLTGISRTMLYDAMRKQKLSYQIVAGRRRITPQALRAYVRAA
jgi:predicted DNA-binding transcriptional regulator AlpA